MNSSVLDQTLNLSKLAKSLSNSQEGILAIESTKDFTSDFQSKESLLSRYQILFSTEHQEGNPDFIKLYCHAICLEEELLGVAVPYRNKQEKISSYIKNVLYKFFGISIKLPFYEDNFDIENYIQNKFQLFEEVKENPDFLTIKSEFELAKIRQNKTEMLSITQSLAKISKALQIKGIVPIIELKFNEKGLEDIKIMLDLLAQFLSEIIYSLQTHDVLLEGLILSFNLPGIELETVKNYWRDDDSVERIVFLNQIAWLRTIPPAIPCILINEGNYFNERINLMRHCEILSEFKRLKIECPWEMKFCIGRMLYDFLFEESENWEKTPKIAWNIFNRRLKVVYDSFQGSFNEKKVREVTWEKSENDVKYKIESLS